MPSPFSHYWYRLASLRPRLRSHVQIHRHHYRGKLWYVLQDHSGSGQHRLSPAAYALVAMMDGARTVQEIYELAETKFGDEAPSKNDLAQLLAKLHTADLMQVDVSPDLSQLFRRQERHSSQDRQSSWLNPLSMRFALFDPERILALLVPLVRPFQNRLGMLLWLAVVGTAAAQAAIHWAELTHNVTDRILTPQNMVVLWLLFPLLKIAHELGHGLATKLYGGEVHEMGILLVTLQPIPYVDVSEAASIPSKNQRVLVGAAGMMVELFVAALALFLWLNVEAGAVRTLAYNVVFIAGISTVLFNANPLLRYDGYYMLADYLEIPNLRTRSQTYLLYLCERYIFSCQDASPEPARRMERIWLTIYPIAAFLYRVFVLAAVALFLASKFFFIGVLLAAAGVVAWVFVPWIRGFIYLCSSPRIHTVRRRALSATVLVTAALAGAILWLPLPLRTRAEGVIWLPEHAQLRAATDGFVERIVARPGSRVSPGDILIVCHDPQLTTRVKVLEARLDELETRYTAQLLVDVRQAQIVKDQITHAEQQLAHARERVANLTIRSRSEGVFEIPDGASLQGRFVRQGAGLGYVLNISALTARVVVPEADAELVRHQTKTIELRLIDRPDQIYSTLIQREVPAANETLPTSALGTQGGGKLAVDPLDKNGVKSLEKIFQFDVALPQNAGIRAFGGRVLVRFDHGWEPIASRWHRQLRQLFLSRFHV
jgi:putative peptide zinc metalloprotease protein